MGTQYHLPGLGVNSAPISGHCLAFNRHDRIGRAFVAADLFRGILRLTEPTKLQSAFLARVNPTYVHWAVKRQAERAEIEAGLIPLVPAPLVPKANGNTLPAVTDVDDATVVNFVRRVGVTRVLEAAVVVEAAQ
jgi:hypothetical protein